MHPEHHEREGTSTGVRFPLPEKVTPEERAWFLGRLAPKLRYDPHFSFSITEEGDLFLHDRSEKDTTLLAPIPTVKNLYADVARIVSHLLLEGPHVPAYQPLERADDRAVEREIDRRIRERRGAVGKCLHTPPIRLLLHLVPFASEGMRTHDYDQRRAIGHALLRERDAEKERHDAEQRERLQAFLDEHAGELARALRDTVASSTLAKQQAEKYRRVPHLDIPLEEVRLRKIRIAGYPASVEYRQNSVMIYIQVAPRSTYAVLVPKGETVQLGEGDQRFSGVECSHPREGTLARLTASGPAQLEITLEEWKYREPKLPERD
ncbi:MAG: hypothetical protein AAB728_01110 [Patescibacteria group bacterium]